MDPANSLEGVIAQIGFIAVARVANNANMKIGTCKQHGSYLSPQDSLTAMCPVCEDGVGSPNGTTVDNQELIDSFYINL